MTPNLVSLHDAPEQPWRNGGGTTRELAAWPLHGEWQVRVSVATIAQSGPFSPFAGIDRWFTVLEGDGVRLGWPGRSVTLAPGDDPLGFDGSEAPACELLGAPTLDLNLMSRRHAGRAVMRRAHPGSTLHGVHGWCGLYAHGPALLLVGENQHTLSAGTLAWAATPHPSAWKRLAGSTGPAWWLSLESP